MMTFKELLTHLNNIKENDEDLLDSPVTVVKDSVAWNLDLALHINENCLYFVDAMQEREEEDG